MADKPVKPVKPVRLTDKRLAEALHKSGGSVVAAASALGVDRVTVWRHMKKSPELQQARDEAADFMDVLADSVLLARLKEGDLTAAMFVKNNSPASKRRGWGPRNEITGAGGGAVTIRVVYDDATTDSASA